MLTQLTLLFFLFFLNIIDVMAKKLSLSNFCLQITKSFHLPKIKKNSLELYGVELLYVL